MLRLAVVLTNLVLLLGGGAAVNIRRHGLIEKANKTRIGASSFSASFTTAVDAYMDGVLPVGKPSPTKYAFVASEQLSGFTKGHAGLGLISLAARGASELDMDTATQAIDMPEVMKLLRRRHGADKGPIRGAATTDSEKTLVEKAVVNLNNMVAEAQKRYDAKNDECEEERIRYTQTLDQINSDLARMGEEMSNTARAITNHMGGIEANRLNNEQTKEELQREEQSYNEVRDKDEVLLKERQANLMVSEFILVFSACPGGGSLLQGASTSSSQLTSTRFQTCVNGTNGSVKFEDPHLDSSVKRLSSEGQEMLLRFMLAREQLSKAKGGRTIAGMDAVTAEVQAAALSSAEGLGDGDDGDMDGVDETEEDESPASTALAQLQEERKPDLQDCGFAGERVEVPRNPNGKGKLTKQKKGKQPCKNLIAASCCNCNKYYTTVKGHANDEKGWCFFVPEKRTCQSGNWLVRHKRQKAQKVCIKQEPGDNIIKPGKKELKRASRCSNAKFDCGALHDMFAGLWGETKDLVDELVAKMNADTKAWDDVKADINALFQMQATQLSSLQAALAEASAMKAAQTDEQAAKQEEKESTQKLFDSTMKECKDVMKEILFTEICGVLAVRNNMIAEKLPDEPKPVDCNVGEWVASDCSVPCDDEMQGGIHALQREVITRPMHRGAYCPALQTTRKCNQIKCPVNCGLSAWSDYNKCTKECGGGVQSHMRTLDIEPKNGGQACDALMESRTCNTGSCDKDCVLGEWQPFKPCTKSCNSGYEERRKRMIAEAEGEGLCLKWDDEQRLQRKSCNTLSCNGDETCNSTLDLVIAVDGSGSITEKGFDILKTFAAKLVRRMMAPVRVGIIQFGNGKLDDDRIISDALVETDRLESDMESVAEKVEGMTIKKGFTNMAQAFLKAKDLLTDARKEADSTLLLITDGRPSFKFQTGNAVKEFRKSSRLMIVHVTADRKEEMAKLLKGYVSDPWPYNYRYIPGKKALSEAYESYATSVLADVCPKLISPSAITECVETTGETPTTVDCECGPHSTCKVGEFCKVESLMGFCTPPEKSAST